MPPFPYKRREQVPTLALRKTTSKSPARSDEAKAPLSFVAADKIGSYAKYQGFLHSAVSPGCASAIIPPSWNLRRTPPSLSRDKKVTSPLQSPCGASRSKPAGEPILQVKLNGIGRLVPPDRLSRDLMR